MAKHPLWSDEYWLLLMQIYLRKPVGVKPLYSKQVVGLALELHIPPQFLYEQMFRLRALDTPQIEKLWERYGKSPRRLARGVQLLRQMKGFGQASDFYDGVTIQESFERDFKPIEVDGSWMKTDLTAVKAGEAKESDCLMPIHLVMVLDLYFRLTPSTMVKETPEVVELSRLMSVPTGTIVDVMEVFRVCDPYLKNDDFIIHPLLDSCFSTWRKYADDKPERLASLAAQLKNYFKE
ncbi:MAG: hypothetical protein IJ196_07605 [Prevotella sp.]|nr:hypothetical protein [Prevotella sp.]